MNIRLQFYAFQFSLHTPQMTHASSSIPRFCTLHHNVAVKEPLPPPTKMYGFIRVLWTCASPSISCNAPLVSSSSAAAAAAIKLAKCCLINPPPQRSEEWFALRRDKLTTSTFSTVLGFWKGKRRYELWQEKVFDSQVQGPMDIDDDASKRTRCAIEWGIKNEAAAVQRYKGITGRVGSRDDVGSLGFVIHSSEKGLDWLGASPDGLLGCDGILEVKCPYNKGKPETGLPWSSMPFYYMPQVQGQMEIMDRNWTDLYCWTPNGSTIFRVSRDRDYWKLMLGILREFWWENVVPAREALLLLTTGEDAAAAAAAVTSSYQPTSTHTQTALVLSRSIQMAKEAKLLCREIAGHIEFYR
ncbi:uncharacterized protein LOC124923736 isoform X2 [Impatiens glandulifera]|uniref:uncharacterized protein LOC124923736 isoform X2 n=1 Tax=Impatiens glandulifera TaxID=253017 RepID=UPI001FB0AEC1|nr:uncharacterized protein LOC124923736 isoform X2 [Impatiens glandulifera]